MRRKGTAVSPWAFNERGVSTIAPMATIVSSFMVDPHGKSGDEYFGRRSSDNIAITVRIYQMLTQAILAQVGD
jgi:hypothetical protein